MNLHQDFSSTVYRGVASKIVFSGDVLPNIQVFRCGTFYDQRYGAVPITPDVLRKMKANFDANVRGLELALDFSHENQSIAAGWFKSLELRNNDTELWAIVDYTDEGRDAVQGKKFKYVSPEFLLEYQDNESLVSFGPVLLGAGLTNRPVIKGMAPAVALHELSQKEVKKMKELTEKLDALLKENQALSTKFADIEKKFNAYAAPAPGTHPAVPTPAPGHPAPAAPAHPAPAPAPATAPADMSAEDMMKLISELQAQIQQLKSQLDEAEEEKELSERKVEFNKMLSEGRVVEAQRESFLKKDFKKFTELQGSFKLSDIGQGGNPLGGPSSEKNAQDEIREKAIKMSEDKKIKIGDAMKVVLREHPDLAKKYRQEVAVTA